MSQASEQIARQFANALANTKTPWGSILINPKEYGAKGDGVTDDTAAIQAAITDATAGEQIVFPDDGVYMISSPIVLNKKVPLISWNRATIKASVPMEALIKCTGFTNYNDMHISGLYLDANHKANHCILLDGSVGTNSYITRTTIENCECRNAVLDGIHIEPPAWDITIKNTLSNENGRDGIRAIMAANPTINQVNNILIDTCICNDNTGHGINILGINNGVVNCDIEGNNLKGINIDATQTTGVSDSFFINVKDNYIEGNTANQIYINTPTGDGVAVNIEDNYINPAGKIGTAILCAGAADGIILNYSGNRFDNSSTNMVLDGGNALSSKSMISGGLYLHETKFINFGYARVIYDRFLTVPMPLSTNRGAALTSLLVTENILALTVKKISVPVPADVTQKIMHSMFININSNCTSFTMRASIFEYDLATSAVTKGTFFDFTSSGNAQFSETIVNNWGFYRVPSGKMVYMDFEITAYVGTTLTFNTPHIKLI